MTNMANASSKPAASGSWNGGKVAMSLQNDDHETSLDTLPYDILIQLLSLSLEPYLFHTSHAIRQKLGSGLGGDQAFSNVAESIILVALLPPCSWTNHLSSQSDFSFMSAERSRNAAQHIHFQEQVFRSGWFHPRVVRLLLPQLMKISLEKTIGIAEASIVLQDMCKRYPNFLKLGQAPRLHDSCFEYISSEGITTSLQANPFLLQLPKDPSMDFRLDVFPPSDYFCVVGICHVPDALLKVACLGTEESIQLMFMFLKMMDFSKMAHAAEKSGVLPISINKALLASAIDTNLSQGNADAVRMLVALRDSVKHIWAKTSSDEAEALIEPRWYLLAARSPNKLMLHNLAQLETSGEYEGIYMSIPYWDNEFVEALSRLVMTGVERWTLEAYACVLRVRQNLDSYKSPGGGWMCMSITMPKLWDEEYINLQNYSKWMAHRENRAKEMANILLECRWNHEDLDAPEFRLHEKLVQTLRRGLS